MNLPQDIDIRPATLTDVLPTKSLSAALSHADIYAAVCHLFHFQAITPSLLTIAQHRLSQTSQSRYQTSLRNALRHLLPLTLLPQALSGTTLTEDTDQLLLSLIANLKLPSLITTPFPTTVLRSRISENIRQLHAEDGFFEEVSSSLAQTATGFTDDLTDFHNRLLPSSHTLDSSSDLAPAIRRLKMCTEQNEEVCMHLDSQIMHTQHTAIGCLNSAYRQTLQATERDTMERSSDPPCDESTLDMLRARTRAIATKLRLIRAEIGALVYTPEACASLRIMAAEIAERKESKEKDLQVQQGRLDVYRSMGSEFEGLLGEIENAKKVLENKKWSRETLNA